MFYYLTHRLSAERTPGSMFYYVTHRLSADSEHTPPAGPGGGGSGSAAAARAGSLAAIFTDCANLKPPFAGRPSS